MTNSGNNFSSDLRALIDAAAQEQLRLIADASVPEAQLAFNQAVLAALATVLAQCKSD